MTALQIDDLTVRYGGVVPLDGVTLTMDGGTWGLIGPNGAGKTTFFNVLSGFARPSAGAVTASGQDLLTLSPHRRARWGVRRSFQTEQAVRELSVADNVLLGQEHVGRRRGRARLHRDGVREALDFVGLASLGAQLVGSLPAHQRRLVELARVLVGTPRLVLLDEPAAGLPDEETAALGSLIRQIPQHYDATVILVDHDMSLVSACCDQLAVLDFGKVIASGLTAPLLRDPRVLSAYLGEGAVPA